MQLLGTHSPSNASVLLLCLALLSYSRALPAHALQPPLPHG